MLFEQLESRSYLSASFVAEITYSARTASAIMLPGDLNGDGRVDVYDLNALTIGWQTTYNIFDLNNIATHWQQSIYDWHTQTINGVLNIWAPNPSDFGETFTVSNPVDLFGGDGVPQMEAVRQGPIGDCYFLAAIASMAATHPERIESLIQTEVTGWAVTFTINQQVTTIHTSFDLSLANGAQLADGEVWPLVMEKAFAAFRTWNGLSSKNTLASLSVGNASTALSELNATIVFDSTIAQIQRDLSANLPIVVHTGNAATSLVADHAYAIMSIYSDSGTMEVQAYNPWGFSIVMPFDKFWQQTTGVAYAGVLQ